MRVVITDEARRDLVDIWAYLKQETPFHADAVMDRLEAACAELIASAGHYPLLPGREERGVRRRVAKPYNILYRVRGDLIEVVHVLHGARDADSILFPED